jgi:putative peptide maturation system protein
MKEQLRAMLADSVEYLRALVREEIQPEEAKARLRKLRKDNPDRVVDLVWEKQAFDASWHYDLLIQLVEKGTLSLSFCPDRALPWPLRGVHHASERDLVRVNNTTLNVEQAIACLDFIWGEAPILNRLVNVCLIQEALQDEPIELSDVELQQAMDTFRRANKLFTAEDTHRWMQRHGITHEQLESLAADEATVAKLRNRIVAGRVEDYFARHRTDFDTAFIARLDVADEESAHRIYHQIRTREVDFFTAAERHFLSVAESLRQPRGELFAIVRRRATPPALALIFTASPDDVLGPVPTEKGYSIIRLLSQSAARLDKPTREAIEQILFEEWLEDRRQAARIEWFWGNVKPTSPAA